jgi:hypothetical protein
MSKINLFIQSYALYRFKNVHNFFLKSALVEESEKTQVRQYRVQGRNWINVGIGFKSRNGKM